MRSKKSCQYAHAKRRAYERYGLDYTRPVRNRLVNAIRDGHGTFLLRESHRLTHWMVEGYRVVYDKQRKEIATFLPPYGSPEDIEYRARMGEDQYA